MIYVALLRGINVGGNNKIEMKKLKSTFESLGFNHVVTYINSGNIIFETIEEPIEHIEKRIEQAITKDFSLNIRVLLRSFENIKTICQELPDSWVKNQIMRTDVLFLWEEFDNPESIDQLKISSVDNVKYISGAVLWNVEEKDYSKSGMQKLVGTKIYKNMTVRNVNTVRKLYQMMTDIDDKLKTSTV
ncbi:MAG TPA: DUF1697 domain-containing protein [Flavobacterium sp.]|nr:DUF1697 domain-containing protein [Flavobacterium sp.]